MSDHDLLLRQTIARHFPAAEIQDRVVALGVGDLSIECWVNHVGSTTDVTQTSLFFLLRGGELGPDPVFASVSGYGTSPEESIVTGACNWACSFGPVLRAGLTDEAVEDVSSLTVDIDGQEFDVFVDNLDRWMGLEPGLDLEAIGRKTRARFAPSGWLTQEVINSGLLPLLAADRPTILSVFVSGSPINRIVELKIDGADWPHASAVFADVEFETDNVMVLMRELAVLVPASRAPRLAFDPIAVALGGIGDPTLPREVAGWPGWKHHGGLLRDKFTDDDIAKVEAVLGPLPADYRAFLIDVGSRGAGPGYGLIDPIAQFQGGLVGGEFSWIDESEGETALGGALALAHAGCGVMWLLVLRGPHRGEVWLDARSSDGHVRRVAPSFDAWYRDWLSSSVRNIPFVQWDPNYCAAAGGFRQVLEHMTKQGVPEDNFRTELPKLLKPGAIKLQPTGALYFGPDASLNPCYGCVTIARQLGLDADVFAAGVEPG